MKTKNTAIIFGGLTLLTALTACGGGSGSSTTSDVSGGSSSTTTNAGSATATSNTAALSNTTAQGIWQSASGTTTNTSSVVTESGQIWSILTTAGTTRLVKASLANSTSGFTGSGKSFVLGTTVIDAVNLNLAAIAKTTLSGNISNTTQTEAFSLAYQTRYDTPVSLANFSGVWQATLGPGTVNWNVSNSGAITGTRTTGCTYVGQLSLRPEAKAVADVTITESCPAITQLSGVALKTADNTGITMLMTTSEDAQGVLLSLH